MWKKGKKRVVCLDEVGRGSLAGPVVAAAVSIIPNSKFSISKIKDSKKLTPKARNIFYKILTSHPCIEWSVGKVYPRVIDRINILESTKLAMKRAVEKLKERRKIDFLILDGKMELHVDIPQKSIVKADERVFSCAAASIIAKVRRDKAMIRYHKRYPQYGFDLHKGYGTKYHLKKLKQYKICPIHRRSFEPEAKQPSF